MVARMASLPLALGALSRMRVARQLPYLRWRSFGHWCALSVVRALGRLCARDRVRCRGGAPAIGRSALVMFALLFCVWVVRLSFASLLWPAFLFAALWPRYNTLAFFETGHVTFASHLWFHRCFS